MTNAKQVRAGSLASWQRKAATVIARARTKANLLAKPSSIPGPSALAGAYVGFGMILILSIGAPLAAAGSPAVKVVMGVSFGVALALVIFAGSELFTGNNMVMTIGSLAGEVSWDKPWACGRPAGSGTWAARCCWRWIAVKTGLVGKAPFKDFLATAALAKMNAPSASCSIRPAV